MLFVAASGSATNAWLGSMGLAKQTLALEALGVDRPRVPVGAGVVLDRRSRTSRSPRCSRPG